MFFSILKWILISLTLIFLVHHLYMFLLNTLTVPKIKDLVNKPNQQYKDIFDTLNTHISANINAPINANINAPINAPIISNDPVADELSSFLNDLKKNTTQKKSNNDFESYTNDSIGSGNSNYSIY